MRILVAEDEPALRELLRSGLEEEGHQIISATDGNEALTAAEQKEFDAVILDIMMPGLDGIAVLRRLRANRNEVPVLLLTARDAPADIVRGLDGGADDYLTKPFAFDELLARLRAITRRSDPGRSAMLAVEDLALDSATHLVTRAGKEIELTATEFRLLEYLMRRNGRLATRSEILDTVWGLGHNVENNTLDVFIRLLRSKVDGDSSHKLIQTVRGFGYRLGGAHKP